MEIRQVVRGQNTSFSPTAPTKGGAKKSAVSRPSADRLELSRQWVAAMEEQRVQTQAELLSGGKEQKKSQGILDLLDQPTAEEQELDALSKQLDVQRVGSRTRTRRGRRPPGRRNPPPWRVPLPPAGRPAHSDKSSTHPTGIDPVGCVLI